MKKILMAGILVVLGVFSGASIIQAQLPTGTILGVVSDSSGASVPDANVTITNTDTNITRTVTTGTDGSYRVPALQPGHYSVTVGKTGFNTETQTGLELVVDQELPVNVSLSVGSTSQAITVTTEAPQVDTTTSSLGGLVNETKIEDLPLNGRNFVDLATLQAGVTAATDTTLAGSSGTAFSSNGAPVRSNNFTLDGAPMANIRGNTAGAVGTTLGVDGIQEYKVITSAFTAEYGLNMGSQVVIVSKGGTNQFHGDAFEYLRNDALDSRSYFDHTYITSGKRLAELRRNQFGGAFGGPIQKDKTFFYAVYEGQRLRTGASATATVFAANCHVATANPCATASNAATPVGTVNPAILPFLALYPLPNLPGTSQYSVNNINPTDVDYGQIRVDHNFSEKDSMFGRYTTQAGRSQTAGTYTGLASTLKGRDQFTTLSENHIFSATVLNTARASYSRSPILSGVLYPAALAAAPYEFVAGQIMGNPSIGGISAYSPTANAPSTLTSETYTASDDVYYTKGKHAFKFGTLINRFEYYTLSVNYNRGTPAFSNAANFLAGNYTLVTIETPGSNQTREVRFYTYGFYGQDDWRVSSRLTLNLGLRYEPASTPLDRKGSNYNFLTLTAPGPTPGPPFRNATHKNISPRVGFAWNVRGNGKTSIRGAFGEFYDVTGAGFAFYTLAQGSPPTSTQITLPAGFIGSTAQPGLPFNVVGAPGTTIRTNIYNDQAPHLLQWNLTAEQQLAPNLSLSLSYVGTRGIHLYDEEEVNPCLPTSITNGVPFWQPTFVKGVVQQCPNPRLNPSWGDAIGTGSIADSYYDGLQAVVSKRVSHGLEVQGAYTYSHVLDDTQGLYFGSECSAGDGVNIQTSVIPGLPHGLKKFNYGASCFDVTHYLRAQVLYHFPTMSEGNKLVRGFANGWWMGDITSWQTGFPISPMVNNWRSLDDNMTQLSVLQTDHPDLGTATVAPGATGPEPGPTTTAGTAPGVNTTATVANPAGVTFIPYNKSAVILGGTAVAGSTNLQWFNPLMFVPGPLGYMGTSSRSQLRGPHFANFDFSLNKDTSVPRLGEAGKLEFRAEFFNILNHTNLGLPSQIVYAGNLTDGAYNEAPLATAGQISGTTGTARQIQLSLKLIF